MPRIQSVWVSALLSLSVASSSRGGEQDKLDFFEGKSRPVLVERCYKCHSQQADKAEGGFLLDSRAGIRSGGESGAAVVPHKPEASLLLEAMRYESLQMPPTKKLPPDVVADFEAWIKDGAIDPREGFGTLTTEPDEIDFELGRTYWAFVPPQSHAAPSVEHSDWPKSKIDTFVLSAMESEGLSPAAAADRNTLARRVYYDMIGLPPTPEELERFLQDESESAYETLVDQLLKSPRFGEKWARLWLDVARFAEDQAHIVGKNKSLFFPNAYLYRDWLINALNDDLPYDEFIRRQLAADMMPGLDERERVALGFIGLGPKYYRRNDPEVMADEWEDRVDTVSRGLLGLTVACARCHDHKYDPIATEDYYALAGVFASTEMSNAPIGKSKTESEPKAEKSQDEKSNAPTAAMHIVREGKPRDIKVHIRGNVKILGDEVPRGFLRVLGEDGQRASFTQGSGRLELASAIAGRDNPLAARVIVNRVWRQLFDQHLVATPSNFGTLGERPSHPELLDDLAVRFMDEGWSLKKLIREIVLSATYRQSSNASPQSLGKDPQNRYLSRMNRRRLSIDRWRDGVLAVSGRLSNGIGGQSIDVDDPKETRRTIYSKVSRFELNPMLSMFDFPDPNVHAAQRVRTTTALQRLFHLNSPFIVAHSEHLAQRLTDDGDNLNGQIDRAYKLLLSRSPDAGEVALAKEFLAVEDEIGQEQRWQQYAQTLLICNEMIYLD